MKVSQAIIKFSLNGRANERGEKPIVINISFHGRIRRNTGLFAQPRQWETATQRLKPSHPLATKYNIILDNLEHEIKICQAKFIENGTPYTPEMLWEQRGDNKSASLFVSDVIKRYVEENGIKWSTITKYKYTYSLLKKFFKKEKILLTEIDESTLRQLGVWLKRTTHSDGTINQFFARINALFNFCIQSRQILLQQNPFIYFKYGKSYKPSVKNVALTKQQMESLESYWQNSFIDVDQFQGRWWYKLNVYDNLQKRTTKETALTLFLIMWRFQGLAVADLARLKISDFTKKAYIITDENGNQQQKEYYEFNGIKRQKTGGKVILVVEDDNITEALLHAYMDTASQRDDYLFPLFQNNKKQYNYQTEKDFTNALIQINTYLNRGLKKVIKDFNEQNPDVPIPENTTFYCARHSFATAYMASNGANPLHLARMMGRDKAGIFDYVADLQKQEDVANERARMGISY